MTKKCLGLWTKTPKLGKIIMLLLYSTQLCRLIFVSLFNYSSTIFSTKETNGLNLSLTMYLTFSAYSMIRLLVCHTYDVMCSLCTLLAPAVCKGRSNRK